METINALEVRTLIKGDQTRALGIGEIVMLYLPLHFPQHRFILMLNGQPKPLKLPPSRTVLSMHGHFI